MALTQISTGGVKNDAVTAGKIPADAVGQSEIADEAVDEARLQISNAGTNGQFLSKQSGNTGGLTWADVPAQYTHPNHSGEVTSTGDGATVIASNIVDEDNLKISNAGTNGQYLQKQSGNTGGLTWADVSAGAEITATADGAIAANKPIAITADGKVAEIKNTTVSAATGSDTDVPHESGHTPSARSICWISETKFVLFWTGTNNNNRLFGAVGTVSGTTISYGSRTAIGEYTDTYCDDVHSDYDSQSNAVVVCYRCTGSSSIGKRIKGLTVSGTTISVNSTNFSETGTTEQTKIASDQKGGFIMTYVNNSNTWYAKAGTISNTGAIYCGSDLHIANSVNSGYDNGAAMCYDKDSDRFVCISRVSSNLHQWLCSRTGTTVVNQHQNGSPSNITGSVGSSMVGIAYDEVNKKFFIIAKHSSNTNLYYTIKTMNGTDNALSGGNTHQELFTSNIDVLGNMSFDKASGKFFWMFADSTGQNTKFLTITINHNNNTASVSSETIASHKEQGGAIVGCSGDGKVFTAVDKSDDSDINTRIKQFEVTTSNLRAKNFIGFSDAAYSDGNTATVKVASNTTTQSGLTPASTYYVQEAGTLSTLADDPSVVAGIAIASDKLLIKG